MRSTLGHINRETQAVRNKARVIAERALRETKRRDYDALLARIAAQDPKGGSERRRRQALKELKHQHRYLWARYLAHSLQVQRGEDWVDGRSSKLPEVKFPCSRCGASEGQQCRSPQGLWTPVHIARRSLVA